MKKRQVFGGKTAPLPAHHNRGSYHLLAYTSIRDTHGWRESDIFGVYQ